MSETIEGGSPHSTAQATRTAPAGAPALAPADSTSATTVLVTGANSGIGMATVRLLGERDAIVIGTVRSDESEQQVRAALGDDGELPSWLSIERLDVTDVEAGRALMKRCKPDVLVNNAGSTLLGAVAETGFDDVEQQFRSTVFGPVFLARSAVEVGGCKRVINVGSVVAEGVIPFTGWYGASKAALEVVSDVWRVEAGGSGVEIVTVECGAIGTDIWERAGETVAGSGDPATAGARKRWASLTNLIKAGFGDPDDVAKAIAGAALAAKPSSVIHVGFGARLIPLVGHVPRPVREGLTKVLFGLNRRRP
ncbi:MAG: SDR family NAD(P)-dependent oxidoreductase [Microthrixaceae bacterium]